MWKYSNNTHTYTPGFVGCRWFLALSKLEIYYDWVIYREDLWFFGGAWSNSKYIWPTFLGYPRLIQKYLVILEQKSKSLRSQGFASIYGHADILRQPGSFPKKLVAQLKASPPKSNHLQQGHHPPSPPPNQTAQKTGRVKDGIGMIGLSKNLGSG